MPDQWGRPTLNDAMDLAKMGMMVGGTIRQQQQAERAETTFKQQQEEKLAYDQYAALIEKGKVPEKELEGNPINHKALASAYADNYQRRMGDTQVRKAEFDLSLAKATNAKRNFIENISRAEAMSAAGNTDQATAFYVEAYKYINNGDNIEYDPVGKKAYQLVPGDEGTLQRGSEVALPTREQMQKMAQDMLDKNNFEQMYVSQRLNNRAVNASAVKNPIEVVDSEGNTAGWMAKGVDPDTGVPDWHVSLNDGTHLSYAEARKKGYQMKEGWSKEKKEALGLQKAEEDIKHVKAATEHERAATEKVREEKKQAKSPEEKYADFLIKATHAKDLNEAATIIRQDKTRAERLKILAQFSKDEMLDMNDPEDKAAYDNFAKSLGVYEDIYAKPGPKFEIGLGEEEKKGEAPPVAGAKKAPDGFWYIPDPSRPGKYKRVVNTTR